MDNANNFTGRILVSLNERPNEWKIFRLPKPANDRLWLRNEKTSIDIAVDGPYWVDIHDKDSLVNTGAPLSLGWFNHRKIRKATNQLLIEQAQRRLDRNDM